MQTTSLSPGTDVAVAACDGVDVNDNGRAASRLRRPDRQQTTPEPGCLEDRLPDDHPAHDIGKVVERFDLSKVRCVAPWSAPAYNVMHFAAVWMS